MASMAGMTLGSTSRTMMRPLRAPIARAARTNSRSDHVSVVARVIRPSSGIETMPSPRITTIVRRVPVTPSAEASTVTSDSASTNWGMARNTFIAGVAIASKRPRKNPAIRPIVPPINKPRPTAPKPTRYDARAP